MVEHYQGDIYEKDMPPQTLRKKLRQAWWKIIDAAVISAIIFIAIFPITLCLIGAGAIIFETWRHL